MPILTAIISYFAAVSKSKSDLAALKEQHKTELEKIEKQAKADIEKLEKDMAAQAKLYEATAQTDVMKEVMGKVMNSPAVGNVLSDFMTREFNKQFGKR